MGVLTENWVGWYEQDGERSSLSNFALLITDGSKLSGSGTDELGEWTWAGTTDDSGNVVLRKQYVGGKPHSDIVTYTGKRGVSGGREVIDGSWNNAGDSGAFFVEKQTAALEEKYTGYYAQDGTKYNITSTVLYTTSDNKIFGSGADELGEFTWTGEFDPTSNRVTLHKLYLNEKTSVAYTGTKSVKDGNTVIEGTWLLEGSGSGTFYLGLLLNPYTGWYDQDGTRYELSATLVTQGTKLSGSGSDTLGNFTWEGENVSDVGVVLRKTYIDGKPHADTLVYTGTRSFQDGKEVIDGTWTLNGQSGPFHFEIPVTAPVSSRPPTGITVSIRSTQSPNAYLRLDGAGTGTVNLQVGRASYERFELVPLEEIGGEQVYAIKSSLFKTYLRLVPTVLPGQEPASGTTFYARGVGFAEPVKEVDGQSKFTAVVNDVEGVISHSFKLLDPGTSFDKIFLRLNANNLSADKTGSGGGEVNGQTYIGPFERLLVEPFK